MSPPCQAHIEPQQLDCMEAFYPLHALVCEKCLLVQLGEYVAPDNIFTEYAYFSSYSDSWVEHARRYTEAMRESFGIGAKSLVTEIASNDGYLLQHFVKVGVPVLGIEPACARDRSFCRCVSAGADGVPRRRLIARFIQRRHIRPIYCEGKSH